MDLDEQVDRIKFLLRDRDTKFTAVLDAVFTGAGIRILRSPVHAPRATAIMERWIGSCRRELIDHTLIWNRRHLLQVLREYEAHHNAHRPHRFLSAGRATEAAPSARRRPRHLPRSATRPGRRRHRRVHRRSLTRCS